MFLLKITDFADMMLLEVLHDLTFRQNQTLN